ncbi:unnamed protein product [Caenorhabditis sp. 36 PRJEB53466]|nr:unnamed protein product [Caenorhabditis sp. 36 PRJEB53466]
MLILFEVAAGYVVFKLSNEKKLENVKNVWEEFNTAEMAQENLQLVTFKQFSSKQFKFKFKAVDAAPEIAEGKLSLKKLIKSSGDETGKQAVGDAKLGNLIKEKLPLNCVHDISINELMSAVRAHIDEFLAEHKEETNAMKLAVAHSLARYNFKYNPEKIDDMVVQAVSLLDALDKELNNYVLCIRKWYGWHFPELGKIVQDHEAYAKIVKTIGMRQNAINTDLSSILPEDLEEKVKEDAEVSMGNDVAEIDLMYIKGFCEQIIKLSQYRAPLFDYLKNGMTALAPNLTVLLGELVGARLISHAGSIVSLAKAPASTLQILGAERALFRALKRKANTPKYGLIYFAQLITQAPPKMKGKMARMLATKCSLAARIDALSVEPIDNAFGMKCRTFLENVLRTELEKQRHDEDEFKSETNDAAADAPASRKKEQFEEEDNINAVKNMKIEEAEEEEEPQKKVKKEEVESDEE